MYLTTLVNHRVGSESSDVTEELTVKYLSQVIANGMSPTLFHKTNNLRLNLTRLQDMTSVSSNC